ARCICNNRPTAAASADPASSFPRRAADSAVNTDRARTRRDGTTRPPDPADAATRPAAGRAGFSSVLAVTRPTLSPSTHPTRPPVAGPCEVQL
ncbi:hypothetical protein ACFPJ3_04810, partial [Brachybacterium sacelli]|uniref:hypothetical protein n=1 Tax=Brachybacterium sacelli TaxID=173364 RepID=UPI00362315C0